MKSRAWWRLKRYWLLAFAGLYLLIGFLLVPWLAERQILGFATDELQLDARLADIDFNPLTFRFSLKGGRFADQQQEVLAIDALVVNFDPIVSLLTWSWSFDELELHSPHIAVHALEDGRFNWQAILDRASGADKPAPPPDAQANLELPRLQLARLQISGGQVDYAEQRPSGAYTHQFSPIDFTLAEFSTLPKNAGPYNLTAVTESGATLRWTGQLEVQPVRVAGEAGLEGLQLVEVDRYLRPDFPVHLAGGRLSMAARYEFALSPQPRLDLIDGRVELIDPLLLDPGLDPDASEPLLDARRLALVGLSANGPQQTTVQVNELLIEQPRAQVILESDGQINWTRLFLDPEAEDPDLRLGVAQLRLQDGAIDFTDQTLVEGSPLAIRDFFLGIDSVSWPSAGSWPFTLAARLGETEPGQLKLEGTWHAEEGHLESLLELVGLPLAIGNDYLAERARAHWTSGTVNLNGRLNADLEPASLTLEGSGAIADAELRDAVDTRVLAWQGLAVEKLKLAWPQSVVMLDQMSWDSPYLQLLIAEGYETNLGALLVEQQSVPEPEIRKAGNPPDAPGNDPTEPAPAAQPWRIGIGPVDIRAAQLDFRDDNVPGGFATAIQELGGTIGRLDSADDQAVPVALEGKASDQASLAINGEFRPWGESPAADLTLSFQNLELVPLSPYAMKFVGYRIDQGKLGLEMSYMLANRALSGNNHAVLDQFRLGEKVLSESAISAPIELAVALLKNDQGVIDLNIPVSGDLANPEFSLSEVIGQAVGNAVGGIVSAPFRLLAALVGGEEKDLSQLAFEPGRTTLATAAAEHVQKLAAALQQRPGLRLEIRPGWAPADWAALSRQALDTRIQAAGGDLSDPASVRPAIESLFAQLFPEAERLALVSKFTVDAADDQPGKLDVGAYVDALYQQLLSRIDVDEAQLEALARTRAENIRSEMQRLGVDAARLFILDIATLEDAESELILLPLSLRG